MSTCLGKSCSFGLPHVPFVNCCQFMYLVISLLVLRAGYGIRLYQFLIIAHLFTLKWSRFIYINDGPDIKLFILVGLGRSFFVCCLAHRGSTVGFLLLQCSSGVVRHPRDLQVSVATRFCRVLIFASSQYLSVIYLFHVMIHWWVRKPPRGPNNCMFWAMIEAEGEVGYP